MTAHDFETLRLALAAFRDTSDLSIATFTAADEPRLGVVEMLLPTGEYRRTFIVDDREYDTEEAAAAALSRSARAWDLPDELRIAGSPRLAAALAAVERAGGRQPEEEWEGARCRGRC